MPDGGLRPFWFEFAIGPDRPCPPGARVGVGVTAVDRADALAILAERVFADDGIPPIRTERVDVPFHELCPWLVLPNLLEPWTRGVWFPVGYRDG